jgi:hypothetical protein
MPNIADVVSDPVMAYTIFVQCHKLLLDAGEGSEGTKPQSWWIEDPLSGECQIIIQKACGS